VTLLASLSQPALALLVLAVATAFGFRLLGLLRLRVESAFETGLFGCGLGVFTLEMAVFALSIPGWLRRWPAWALVAALALVAGRCWAELFSCVASMRNSLRSEWRTGGPTTRALLVCIAGVSLFEALVTSAPLTGSDAMHYHFTVPLLENAGRLAPRFDLTHSFLVGEAHLLISLGLALGGDRIALGLIYAGGLLTAGTLYVMAKRLSSTRWALLAVLAFLAAPMVFWQITTSGSPDIWMGFFAGIAILAASHAVEESNSGAAILAGLFAGSAAAVKYTGWTVPMAICGYLLLCFRPRSTALWSGGVAFLAGCLSFVRNIVWTRDPFFPFLSRWLNPDHVDRFALTFLMEDTRSAGFSGGPLHLLTFPFLLTIRGERLGLGQYFGPVILAFAPLLIFAAWKNHVARLGGVTLALALLANMLTAQMGRFLLPVYAVGLALAISGVAGAARRNWRSVICGSIATLTVFIVFAGISDTIYARDFLPVVAGRESREAFLRRMAPDYETASFVNETLAGQAASQGGKALVFFRHLFYLRVPFVNGDPATSWVLDPAIYSQPDALLRLLQEQNVKWVVKSPEYPEPLAGTFERLEAEGKLTPIASTEIEAFLGSSRIYGQKRMEPATILRLDY
jgi:Dolichyl-phosphate-mannose-protein mannosyltransferase/Protein of unknown function (DUF1420)